MGGNREARWEAITLMQRSRMMVWQERKQWRLSVIDSGYMFSGKELHGFELSLTVFFFYISKYTFLVVLDLSLIIFTSCHDRWGFTSRASDLPPLTQFNNWITSFSFVIGHLFIVFMSYSIICRHSSDFLICTLSFEVSSWVPLFLENSLEPFPSHHSLY